MNPDASLAAFAIIPAALAVVFVAAGISKLRRPQQTLAALENFGVPSLFRNKATAAGLPALEIALGLALVSAHGGLFTAVAGMVASAVAAFVALTARALSREEQFDCGCFGAARSPIGRQLLLRNLVLLVGAIGSILLGLRGFDGVMSVVLRFEPKDWAWAAVALFLVALVVLLVTTPQTRDLNVGPGTSDGTVGGTTLTHLSFMTNNGEPVQLVETMNGRPHLVVIVRPQCAPCAHLLKSSESLRSDLGHDVGLLLVVVGDAPTFTREHPDLAPVSVFGGRALVAHVGVTAYPAAILVSARGSAVAEPVAGAASIRRLVHRASRLLAAS